MTEQLNQGQHDALWAEIEGLKEQLKELRVARETLMRHHTELRNAHDNLLAMAEKTQRMADEVAQALERSGTR